MRHVAPGSIEPLSEAVLLILLSLAGEPRHGYAILKDVEQLSEGRVVLSTGTLYGALRRLLNDGWIERVVEEETPRDRQVYRLSGNGRLVLANELARMESLSRVGASRLRPKAVRA